MALHFIIQLVGEIGKESTKTGEENLDISCPKFFYKLPDIEGSSRFV